VALVRPLLDQFKSKAAADPNDDRVLSSLSYAQALVGEHDAAQQTVERLLAKLKTGYPLRMQYYVHANAGIVYGWIGEKDKAVDQLLPLMSVPIHFTNNVVGMHEDIDFFPLRGFPRWEALLADPANKQPFKY
jgi:hypothetical protein